MCGGDGFLGGLFNKILSPIFGDGSNQQTGVQQKTVAAPTMIDTGSSAIETQQQERRKKTLNRGFSNNLLAGDTTGTTTQTKNLLGE